MARDPVLVDLYDALHEPFPRSLEKAGLDWVELDQLSRDITGAASHYVNNTRPLTAVHRIWLTEYIADVDRLMRQLPDGYAVEYFSRHREIARYLLATR
jgi:hypothetical protein